MIQKIENNITIITASDGNVFRRKADNAIFGKQIYLGYMYYVNNTKLDTPILATPEMFEEVEDLRNNKEDN